MKSVKTRPARSNSAPAKSAPAKPDECPQKCRKQQSPIALYRTQSFFVPFPKTHLKVKYSRKPYAGEFRVENGHADFFLGKLAPDQRPPKVKLGSVKAQLVKIHLHMPSEHDLEGVNQTGEIHLVHKVDKPGDGSEFIVLGVLFRVQPKSTASAFFQTWAGALATQKKDKRSRPVPASIDIRQLLPRRDRWFRYEGSLTSDPYKESVSWIVFPRLLGIVSADLKLLADYALQPERGPQPINRRFVLRNFK